MFSLIMPSYNNGRFIEVAIRSVLAQTSADWELVIVDDASTDDSVFRAQPFLNDSRIRLIRNAANLGVGGALRKGVAVSRGSVFGMLAPDDALTPQAIEVMVEAHQNNPACSLVYSTLTYCDAELRPSPQGIPQWVGPVRSNCLKEDRISNFATFKRKAYDRTSGFDPLQRCAEDKDIYFKMEEVGSLLFVPETLLLYRRHEGGISQGGSRKLQCRLYYARAYRSAYERRRSRGDAGVTRQEAARRLFELAAPALEEHPGWALHFVREALNLNPLDPEILKVYFGARERGLREVDEIPLAIAG